MTTGGYITTSDVHISDLMMSQHFLLSAKARSLSLSQVLRLTDDAAYETFKAVRWAETDGKPFCAKCGGVTVYEFKARRIFKCKACNAQFSVTSGTIFASRKMAHRDLLAAIAIFVIIKLLQGLKGIWYLATCSLSLSVTRRPG